MLKRFFLLVLCAGCSASPSTGSSTDSSSPGTSRLPGEPGSASSNAPGADPSSDPSSPHAPVASGQLGRYTIAPDATSVSGFSSGGFMAAQLHVALSSTFKAGVGVIAGGPFYCNKGVLATSLVNCAVGIPAPDTAGLISTTHDWAAAGSIDDTTNIGASKVYIFHGTMDTTIQGGVVDATKQYYSSFASASNIKYRKDIGANHAFVTDDFGGACAALGSPYVNNCGFDLPGDLLSWIYGTLNPKSDAMTGSLVSFDQKEFATGHGLADKGWVYVPKSCASGATCKLHVVLHGCQQNETTGGIGDAVYKSAGYNRWADTNDIVVLYPQTGASSSNGCWDYWGYDSPDFAKKSGPQIQAIAKMVARVQGAN